MEKERCFKCGKELNHFGYRICKDCYEKKMEDSPKPYRTQPTGDKK